MDISLLTRHAPRLNLDINSQKNFIKFYEKLGEKPKTTVRFFDRTDYYSTHGEDDCDLVSNLIYKTTAYIQYIEPENYKKLAYVTLSKHNFETAVRELLLVKNFRLEVYTKKGIEWNLEYRGSPGNILQFEDVLFSNREILVGTILLSAQIRLESGGNQHKIGIAAVDQNDCIFQLSEFLDDDFYSEFEATLVLLGPRECVLTSVDGEYANLKKLLDRNNIMVTVSERTKTSEKADFIPDLNRLLHFEKDQQADVNALPESKLTLALEALREAIKYLDLVSDPVNGGQFKIKGMDLKRFVHLDSAAVAALNILPKQGTTPTTPGYRWKSILGVLDRCKTPQGHRLIGQWIKQPLRSKEILNDRHDIVQCLLDSPDNLKSLHEDYLKRIPDILMLTKRLTRRKASLQDIFRIYTAILYTPHIIKTLTELENPTINSMLTDPLKCRLEDLMGLKQMVEKTVDFEAAGRGEFLVNADFDEQLTDLKEDMSEILKKMELLRDKVQEDLELDGRKAVKLENVSHLGYHFRITLKDDATLRKHKNYRVLDVVKGGVRFTNDKMESYSDKWSALRSDYEDQQKSIVTEIIKIALTYTDALKSLNSDIAVLDCLVSLAIVARSAPIPYVRPKIWDEGSGILILKDLRHPCLEIQENVSFIANSVEFKPDECNMIIITGPNMGGKSTYIRSVGTAVLMAHVGSFVPSSSADISMVDSILARLGASDNIMKGLSTFMVEMIETSGIVRSATSKSLVIIDELGRGTSTYEGCGIAWSIAEYMAKEKKCFSLFATHFHEITALADYVATVKNFHMAAVASDNTFTLLYQVKPGVMQKSFGIEVAKMANFPDSVIVDAEKYYKEMEDVNADKQGPEDKALLDRLYKAISDLSTGNNAEISDDDLTKLVKQFTDDVKKIDSDYFKAVLSTYNDK